MVRNFGYNLFRNIFMFLDWAVYSLISMLDQAIFDIADLNPQIFQNFYNDVIRRLYIILAIFMLFKITVSLLTYLVNPDTITDKQQGAGKLVTKIIVTLIMLIMAPTIFGLMTDVQKPLLKTLPRLILARTTYNGDTNQVSAGTALADDGTQISWTVLTAFFNRNPECVSDPAAANSEPDYESWIENNNDNTKNTLPANILRLSLDHVNDACGSRDGSIYAYEYTPVISTIAGGFLCYCLIGIAIAVAVRMFKMLILQIIAPIPIMSYIDPKASKDGAFNHWIKLYFTTWLELFINISIVYIIIYLVSNLLIGENGEEFLTYVQSLGGRRGTFFMVFVILGLFAFARQAPKFILDALGIKNGGGFGKVLGMSAAVVRTPWTVANEIREGNAHDEAAGFSNAFTRGWNVLGGIAKGVGSTGMAVGDGYNADKGARQAALNNLDRRRQELLNRDKRMAAVDKEYEDYLTDRFQKKGADIVVSGITAPDGTNLGLVTLNEFDNARQVATAKGLSTFQVNGKTFDTYGSDVERVRGDIIDAGTELLASGTGHDRNGNPVRLSAEEAEGVQDYRRSIRQTGGYTRRNQYGIKPYRSRRKPTERHVNIQNNTRQNRQSK